MVLSRLAWPGALYDHIILTYLYAAAGRCAPTKLPTTSSMIMSAGQAQSFIGTMMLGYGMQGRTRVKKDLHCIEILQLQKRQQVHKETSKAAMQCKEGHGHGQGKKIKVVKHHACWSTVLVTWQ